MFNSFRYVYSFFLALAIFGTSVVPAEAHRKAESYVFFSITDEALSGRFEAVLADIDRMVPLDSDGDGKITEAEFLSKSADVFAFFAKRLDLSLDGASYPLSSTEFGLLETPAGTFGQISFDVTGLSPTPEAINLKYEPLSDAANPSHLGYAIIENNTRTGVENNEAHISLIFNGSAAGQELNLIGDPWHKIFVDFVIHGIWHIWLGFDHVLFLVTLLLPAVLFRRAGDWHGVEDFRTAFINVVKIATVFTISHTITLSLAALGILTLPVTLVEAVIALSIAVVAFGNMYPVFHRYVLPIVFVFGLFHGFGFANVLEPLGLQPTAKAIGLAAFNIGVELGQIAIILVLFPILYLVRNWGAYPFLALKAGSVAIILVACFWMVERSADTFWKYQSQLFAWVG